MNYLKIKRRKGMDMVECPKRNQNVNIDTACVHCEHLRIIDYPIIKCKFMNETEQIEAGILKIAETRYE